MGEDVGKPNELQNPFSGKEGWPIKELWEKYEDIAMHFNDLLIKLRTQALGAVAILSTLIGIFSKSGVENIANWGLAAAVFFFLCIFWIAIWMLDVFYYNRLLLGAVDAIITLEEMSKTVTHIREIDISTKIERAVAGESPIVGADNVERYRRLAFGRRAFYIIVFVALLVGFGFSTWQHGFLGKGPEVAVKKSMPQPARPSP